jgi:hypothetical protein
VIVPPQVVARPFGVAITRPAGSVSLKPMPVRATVPFGLQMVKVSDVVPFNGTDAAPKAFESVGGATTVIEALEVLPTPPSVDVTVTLLFLTPADVPVTFTLKVQEVLVAREAPLKEREVAPDVAVIVPPPQEPEIPFGLATARPAGRVSVNPTPVNVRLPAGFEIVKLSEVDPLKGIVAAPKDAEMDAGAPTVKLADAVAPVPPLVDATLPVGLVYWPDTAPVTFRENVQVPAEESVSPVTVITLLATVTEPVAQIVVAPRLAAVSPTGSVSVKPTPVSASGFDAGLPIVKVRDEVAFRAMDVGLNAMARVGGPSTFSVAVAVTPVPPSVAETAPEVLTWEPAAVPVTFTLTVQLADAARDPPLRETAAGDTAATATPPQVLARPLGVAMARPAGSVSLKATPVRATVAFGLVMVKVRDVEPFNGTDAAPKALPIVGGATTVTEEFEVLPVPPSVEVTVTLLFLTPAVEPVTFTLKLQEVLVARLAPLRATEVAPATAVIVPPPHVPVRPFGVATTRPAGRESVKAMPFKVTLPAGFVIVKLSKVVPLTGTVAAPKDAEMEAGVPTVSVAVAELPFPPLLEDTMMVEFGKTPELRALTFTLNWHCAPAAIVALLRITRLSPAGAEIVPPPHDPVRPFGVVITTKGPKSSEKVTPVSASTLAAGLVIVKVSVEVPLRGIDVGL